MIKTFRKLCHGSSQMTLKLFISYFLLTVSASFVDDCIQRHNFYRAKHPDTEPLVFDQKIQDFAQEWADYISQVPTTNHHGPKHMYGENIFHTSDKNAKANAAVDRWYCEYENFNWSNIRYSDTTGHFTQVIWRGSKRIGCASAASKHGLFVVANYHPHGNVYPYFKKNLKPANETIELSKWELSQFECPLMKSTTTKPKTTTISTTITTTETTTTEETTTEETTTEETTTEETNLADKIPFILQVFYEYGRIEYIQSGYDARIEAWQRLLAFSQLPPNTDQDLVNIAYYFNFTLSKNDINSEAYQTIYNIAYVGSILAEAMEALLRIVLGLDLIFPPASSSLYSSFIHIKCWLAKFWFNNDEVNHIIEALIKDIIASFMQTTVQTTTEQTTTVRTTTVKITTRQQLVNSIWETMKDTANKVGQEFISRGNSWFNSPNQNNVQISGMSKLTERLAFRNKAQQNTMPKVRIFNP